jgi:hypothetical protein
MSNSIRDSIMLYKSGIQAAENYARIWLSTEDGNFAPVAFATGIQNTRRACGQIAASWVRSSDEQLIAEFRAKFPYAHRNAEIWVPRPRADLADAVCHARDVLRQRGEPEYAFLLDALAKHRGLLDECQTAIWG